MDRLRGGKVAAVAAISGALFLVAGTYLHPMNADPNVPAAAFTEYATDHKWVATHLIQLSGIALMVAALALLSRRLASGPADVEGTLGMVGAGASLAVAAALQAVDGVALKAMVDSWAAAEERDKELLFQAVFAVRQIEIGLASITSLLFGFTVSVYGLALLRDSRFPKWLGFLALAGGAPTAIAGIVIAYSGFSELAMAVSMAFSSLLLCWMVALGVHMWRKPAL
ncbi:MAG TPA: DUF4386 family protein [Myxococcota bacterium]|nr:DUF4386 family protein [Myxococcota bacterium]